MSGHTHPSPLSSPFRIFPDINTTLFDSLSYTHSGVTSSSSSPSPDTIMRCISCKAEYTHTDAGTCKECYEEASDTKEELKREIEDLKSKIAFLKCFSPVDPHCSSSSFTDVVLVASEDGSGNASPSIPAHKAVLISRSPVFKAMLENEMEESRSGTIKITDVSYDVLRSFIHYLYTAEVSLDEPIACDLLVLAEKYQVNHLKAYCENFMTSKVNGDNALMSFAFASHHNAKHLLEESLSVITENMGKLTKQDEYKELLEKDPRLIVGILEACLSREVNTAASKDSCAQ